MNVPFEIPDIPVNQNITGQETDSGNTSFFSGDDIALIIEGLVNNIAPIIAASKGDWKPPVYNTPPPPVQDEPKKIEDFFKSPNFIFLLFAILVLIYFISKK